MLPESTRQEFEGIIASLKEQVGSIAVCVVGRQRSDITTLDANRSACLLPFWFACFGCAGAVARPAVAATTGSSYQRKEQIRLLHCSKVIAFLLLQFVGDGSRSTVHTVHVCCVLSIIGSCVRVVRLALNNVDERVFVVVSFG